jgi:hypothetical protein
MEMFTVIKKNTENVYYVLHLAKSNTELVILANAESGALQTLTLTSFVSEYEFNGMLDDESQEDFEDDEDEDFT